MIREATDSDKNIFIEFSLKLARYNRNNHRDECKTDNFDLVLNSIKIKAENTFSNRNEKTLILIAEQDEKAAGYALARIFKEESTADNGTGRTGLFDELFVEEWARGQKIGQKLTSRVMEWFKTNGIGRIKLQAYTWNKTAQKFYEKNGFREYAVSMEKFI